MSEINIIIAASLFATAIIIGDVACQSQLAKDLQVKVMAMARKYFAQ